MIFKLFQKLRTYETEVMSSHLLIKAKAPEQLLLDAADIAHDIEAKLSAYKDSSELSRINKNAGKHPVKCSALTLDIIKIALEVSEATQGVFDITVGCLTQKGYGFGTDKERLLNRSQRKQLQSFVNYKNVEVSEENVYLKKEGMALDLGGIGKGYAADKIISFLKSKGVKAALVSVGGEIFTYGKVWHVGVQHPRINRLHAQITTTSKDTLVTSSGDYERYIQDPNHHHILQPSNAQSANLYSSLTLVSNTLDAARMDAFNTALFQMSQEAISNLCLEYNMAAILIDKQMFHFEIQALQNKVKEIRILS